MHRYPAFNPHGNLPISGSPVRVFGRMGDENHTPEICAERREFIARTFKPGQIVRRSDGAVMVLDYIGPTTCGGDSEGYGRPHDLQTGETRGVWGGWRAGMLGSCEIVRQPADPTNALRA